MGCCYDPLTVSKESELDSKIIRHPSLYQPRTSITSPWLDLRIFYARFSNFEVNESMPEHLTLKHIPLSPDTIIEVNGKRSRIYSECLFSVLRRDRVDMETEEATFVGTDSIRMTGSVRFEVYNKDDLLLSGTLELCNTSDLTGESKRHSKIWHISCKEEMVAGTIFLKGKQLMGPKTQLPTIDVYVTGCFSGAPIILAKTLQFGPRKSHLRKAMLDPIPEYESTEMKKNVPCEALQSNPRTVDHDLVVIDELGFYRSESIIDDDSCTLYSRLKYLEGEDGDLSWFKAGVRVGVGIGLGVCLSVGVGLGLLVRTYQATTRSFKLRVI